MPTDKTAADGQPAEGGRGRPKRLTPEQELKQMLHRAAMLGLIMAAAAAVLFVDSLLPTGPSADAVQIQDHSAR